MDKCGGSEVKSSTGRIKTTKRGKSKEARPHFHLNLCISLTKYGEEEIGF